MFDNKSVLKRKMMEAVESVDRNKLEWICKKLHELSVTDRLDFAEYVVMEVCKNPFMESRCEWLSMISSAGDAQVQSSIHYSLIIAGYEYEMKSKIIMSNALEIYGVFKKDGYMFNLNTLVDGRYNDDAIPLFFIALFMSGAFDHHINPALCWSILTSKSSIFEVTKPLLKTNVNSIAFNRTVDATINAPFDKVRNGKFFDYIEFTKSIADDNNWKDSWLNTAERYAESFCKRVQLIDTIKPPSVIIH